MGKLDIVHWLWTKGVSLSPRSRCGDTALLIARLMGHFQIVKFLVDQAGIPITSSEARSYWTGSLDTAALHAACRGGHADVAEFLIEKGSPVNEVNAASETPLTIAAASGSLGCVRVLVAQPTIPRIILNRKHSPVVDAYAFGHFNGVKCLIEAGFRPTLPNSQGLTPLECAIRNGHSKVTLYLVEHGALTEEAVGPAVRAACAVNELKTVQLLIERSGVNVATHPDGPAWLQQAVELESREVVEYLLSKGGELEKCSIASAIKRRADDFTDWLLARGSSVTGGIDVEPPIIAAIEMGDFKPIRALMTRGAELADDMILKYP
jgi:ankyrin repeat protein